MTPVDLMDYTRKKDTPTQFGENVVMTTTRAAYSWMVFVVSVVMIATAWGGCSSSDSATNAATGETIQSENEYKITQQFDLNISMSSTKFNETRRIPRQYSCSQDDISPPLSWEGTPAGTVSFALVVDSDEQPGPPWVHWVLWNIPADATGLPESIEKISSAPLIGPDTVQGTNTEKNIGWTGPCPPPVLLSPHGYVDKVLTYSKTYSFKLYALDKNIELESSATKNDLLQEIDGHILGGGQLTGEHVSQKQCRMSSGAKLNVKDCVK